MKEDSDSQGNISVILPCRNRSGTRLSSCLKSLRWQDIPSHQVEIIISDFGSSVEHEQSLRDLSRQYSCRLVRTETEELWNRSKALNIGIQEAENDIVLCTDVDMLFAPNFLSTVVEEVQKNNTLVLCRCRDLPEDVPVQLWNRDDYPDLVERSTLRHALGTGACQATRRQWWFKVRGYDEAYVYWGYEDRDMVWRAKRDGLEMVWIHEKTSMLHQWHEKMSGDKNYLRHKNRIRYFLTGALIKKNRRGWGTIKN